MAEVRAAIDGCLVCVEKLKEWAKQEIARVFNVNILLPE